MVKNVKVFLLVTFFSIKVACKVVDLDLIVFFEMEFHYIAQLGLEFEIP
jgi:hypothetical protein